MTELLAIIAGGIGLGIVLRFICVILGSTVRFMDSVIRAT